MILAKSAKNMADKNAGCDTGILLKIAEKAIIEAANKGEYVCYLYEPFENEYGTEIVHYDLKKFKQELVKFGYVVSYGYHMNELNICIRWYGENDINEPEERDNGFDFGGCK